MQKAMIHFIGIGGIGTSALAQIYLSKGYQISGSDLKASEIIKALQNKGAKIFIGQHKISNLKSQISKPQLKTQNYPDLVVFSPAIPKDNPELQEAKRLKIKCQSYPEALGELSRNYFTIAVAGMHGKSTTASMIAQILIKAGFDPTFVIGTKPNCRIGESKYLVIEADEWKDSLLNYHPDIAVITNIEPEHLDYFKNLENIKKSFNQFRKQSKKVVKWRPQKFKLQVPGKHNQKNASAALAIARELGIDEQIAKKTLFEYKGVWRRFEARGKINGAIIIDDYAHHPTEIQATLQAAREKYPKKKIVAVFQPHQYQRLKLLFDDFTCAFKQADKIIITDVFEVAGRETDKKITAKDLAKAIKGAKYIGFQNLAKYIKNNVQKNDVILMMGAGDIIEISNRLV